MVEVKDNWDYQTVINQNESVFHSRVNDNSDDVLKKLVAFKEQSCNYSDGVNGSFTYSMDDGNKSLEKELKSLVEKNKKLRLEVEIKLLELTQKKNQYQHFKKDQKLLEEEIIDRHEALLMAKKYYKKNLNMYYTIESREKDTEKVLLQLFTDSKRDTDMFSVQILRNKKSGAYELLKTSPTLPSMDELRKMFKENDMPGAISLIRQAFLKIKKSKN